MTGIFLFIVIRYGVGWFFSTQSNPFLSQFGKAATDSVGFEMLAWFVMIGCFLAAAVSFSGGRRRAALVEVQSSLASLSKLSWREFEQLVGEAFRRHGYAVEETGLGGKDGGIDLVLRKDGKKVLVQCKQWRTRAVSVSVAREMYGLLLHHQADAIKIVAVGSYTPDAAAFVAGKPVELIDGEALLALVKRVQTAPSTLGAVGDPASPAAQTETPPCPRCQQTMTKRSNRKTGDTFWGCVDYPRCRGTRVMSES